MLPQCLVSSAAFEGPMLTWQVDPGNMCVYRQYDTLLVKCHWAQHMSEKKYSFIYTEQSILTLRLRDM